MRLHFPHILFHKISNHIFQTYMILPHFILQLSQIIYFRLLWYFIFFHILFYNYLKNNFLLEVVGGRGGGLQKHKHIKYTTLISISFSINPTLWIIYFRTPTHWSFKLKTIFYQLNKRLSQIWFSCLFMIWCYRLFFVKLASDV